MSEQLFTSANLTADQLNAIVKKLGGEAGVMNFLRGNSEVVVKIHIIDLDATPTTMPFDGAKVEEHNKGGKLEWKHDSFRLHLSLNQSGGKSIVGKKLCRELENKPVLNANLLDYLLDHPYLIPEDWKVDKQDRTRYIYFHGTYYRDLGVGGLFVRYLYFRGGHWRADYNWLDRKFGVQDHSLLLVK